MDFEFDEAKSQANAAKHGIDFDDAQGLWQDIALIEIPARTADEARFLVVGRMEGKHWAALVTYRDDIVRIISVRRARPEEIAPYEGN